MFRRLGIAQQIYGSFGLLIVLLAAVCVAGLIGLADLTRLLTDLRGASAQTTVTGTLAQHIQAVQQAATSYRVTHNAGQAVGFGETVKLANFDDPTLLAAIGSDPAMTATIQGLKTDLASLATAFQNDVKINQDRKALQDAMRKRGTEALTATSALLDIWGKTYLSTKIVATAKAMSSEQTMFTAAERYMASGLEGDYKQVPTLGGTAIEALKSVAPAAGDLPDDQAKPASDANAAAIAAMTDYLDMAGKLKALVATVIKTETQDVDLVSAHITSKLSSLSAAIAAQQDQLGSTGVDEATRTLLILAGVGAAALLLGIVMAVIIGRSLSKSIRRMARSMRQMADGDLEAELDAGSRGHELGQMADALEVFRSNGRAIREMDASKAADAARTADALAKREAVLADVRTVVSSALAGDFSGRISLEGAPPDLHDFVSSLNSVMATVETGVGETAAVLETIAEADLSRRVEGDFAGVFERLKVSTNAAADKFAAIIGRLQAASGSLKTATSELLSGSSELSQRTTRQAATIEETSAAMEQLATTVGATATKATEASDKTQAASGLADEGGQVMQRATEAMERITASSGKISNIIALIDDIAFQTNLLALNASVEAARAGEAGKGFAVVAVEVRRLAQSAAKASNDVKALIELSGGEVKSGSKLVAEAAERLSAILGAVRENSGLMASISEATRSQAAAISEVNSAIRSMDEITQHNASLVEQANAAIEQAESQARELDEIVDVFTLAGSDGEGEQTPEPEAQASPVQGMREKIRKAAATFLDRGNTALASDWQDF